MSELQAKFEEALRRAFEGQQPGSVVTVAAPAVTVTPTIKATLPALEAPLEVVDVARYSGAWEYEVRAVRDADGLLISAKLVPVALVKFGENFD